MTIPDMRRPTGRPFLIAQTRRIDADHGAYVLMQGRRKQQTLNYRFHNLTGIDHGLRFRPSPHAWLGGKFRFAGTSIARNPLGFGPLGEEE
jgi:hypothetical protein